MNFDQFKRKIRLAIQVGTIFDNPGKGTSAVTALSDSGISYIRGRSTIYVSFQDLFDALEHFGGLRLTSSDLKSYRPSVFDSKAKRPGHSCNCTFLFMLLKEIGISSEIGGQGIKGNPYFMEIPPIHDKLKRGIICHTQMVVKAITSARFIPLHKLTNTLAMVVFLLPLPLANVLLQNEENRRMIPHQRLCSRVKTVDTVMFVTPAGATAATVHGRALVNARKH